MNFTEFREMLRDFASANGLKIEDLRHVGVGYGQSRFAGVLVNDTHEVLVSFDLEENRLDVTTRVLTKRDHPAILQNLYDKSLHRKDTVSYWV